MIFNLTQAEADLIETLRTELPFARLTIERCDGVWDVTTEGLVGITRGTGTTFEKAYESRETEDH
jgi:hypothetical protein